MKFAELARASTDISATRSRLRKIQVIAACLCEAGEEEIPVVVAYLSGELRQRRVGIGWAAFRDAPAPAAGESLTVSEVDRRFTQLEAMAGAGSAAARRDALFDLLRHATPPEQDMIRALVSGELRQGALRGLMGEAVAKAWLVPVASIRRATMLSGDAGAVAVAASQGGEVALEAFRMRVGVPVLPMLAQAASSVEAALARTGPASVEWKLDGIRVQVHRSDDRVDVFTRTCEPITDRVPEVVEAVLGLSASDLILDGEVIALLPDGRPRPFQETGSRVASRADIGTLRSTVPLSTFFFDLLHADGKDLIDVPLTVRRAELERVCPPQLRIRSQTAGPGDEIETLNEAIAAGHEGVVVKSLASPYEAGRRGTGWIKVKPHHTLDLVILAVERGHGRRQGWLSNLHLGALDAETGNFVMLGKTFKGLTDEMLKWQTEKLWQLAERDDGLTVYVRPELVAEIAFDGVQTSTRYPSGMALRFARVVRYREDKRPDEADAVDAVRAIHTGA